MGDVMLINADVARRAECVLTKLIRGSVPEGDDPEPVGVAIADWDALIALRDALAEVTAGAA